MLLPDGRHLGYCTNVHPYDDLQGLRTALSDVAVPLRARFVQQGRLARDAALGVGLWLPASVAADLARDPASLRAWMDERGLYAFTVNAFPFGDFHGARVKDDVFRPHWGQPERLAYTLQAAEVLAALLPEGVDGSLSTHTGGYRAWGAAGPDVPSVARALRAAAAGLADLQARTGRRVLLALEPEPDALLETTDEMIGFFERHLLPAGEAARRHLGLCFDACHQAVQHEDMADAVARLRAAGVGIAKVQLSSAIRVPSPAAAAAQLAPWAEDRWLHQVVGRARDGRPVRHADLPAALADPAALDAAEWRIHYHVPLYTDRLDAEGLLRTTRPDLVRLLDVLADLAGLADPSDPAVTSHLEIETYSFFMIPAALRAAWGAGTLLDCLDQEYGWVLKHA
jgi:sugar phosphate isomerase/epimerase